MIYDANAIANWFLGRIDTNAGDTISHLKLQKLIYYAQAWHLAIYGKPLFKEKIESWPNGPVVASIYHRFKDIPRAAAIDSFKDWAKTDFSAEIEELLEEVYTIYGEHSAGYLQELTKRELPWKKARKGLDMFEKVDKAITHKDMIDYYKKRMNNGKKAS
ncbi:Panacea domain-containing protein [[Flexibacter] sp. ATCC 35208]|uniref:Panacea domain-containing protein n=1 Tax=[Flexibacter] sp. ATCC 35208 TaxID=1936242 RepID=UPI0009D41525|nr:type II toxin-antitoxin system antitoxin SocA domain-containing protein [[Flexibacter] sp. ATCC 35208]OMP78984.1 hypothetical protein BW716_11515 [[Flexibacter] sp. ATCC 35208]